MLKKIFITELFYPIIFIILYVSIFQVVLPHNNLMLLILICAIINCYTAKFIIRIKNNELNIISYKQRESYISTLTHDLKIPTLAQINALKLLSNDKIGRTNKKQKEIVDLTLESCNQMYEMLSTILAAYRYENKDIKLFYEKINIVQMIEECYNGLFNSLNNKNLKIRVLAKDKNSIIQADKIQIRKAFENLIKFSISSAAENSIIICDAVNKNGKVNLSISFENQYLKTDLLQNMLKKYTTSAEKMDKIGCSLDLYLAKQIISAHNGKLEIKGLKPNLNVCKIEIPLMNVNFSIHNEINKSFLNIIKP